MAVLGFSLVAPIFPLYALGLGASYTMLGIIISVYGGIQLITQVPIGRLSDRTGRKRILVLGLLTFTVMPSLYIYATSSYELIIIRLIGGIGASAVWPLAMALIIERVDPLKRGRAMGWYNAAFYSAVAVGPAIGGGLYDMFGLAAPFYFWAALGLASAVIVMAWVKEPSRREVLTSEEAIRPKENMILPGFTPTFVSCCSMVMWTGVIGGFNFTMLPSFAKGLGLSTIEVGLIYLAYAGCMSISNVHFGGMADRGRRKALMSGGCLLGAISFALLLRAGSIVPVLILFSILGLGVGMSNPAAAAMIADTTCTSRRGEIFGIFNTSRMMGVVIGPLIAGATADAYGVEGAISSFVVIAAVITLASMAIKEPAAGPACTESDKNS